MPPGGGRLLGKAVREAQRLSAPDHAPPSRSQSGDEKGPRSFPYHVKVACWNQAASVPGRDPERWRMDIAGNLLFRKLVGCDGCLCHDYDHVVPFSTGGESVLENCQVLQVKANRAKGNRVNVSKVELMERSAYCHLSARDMDTLELISYGDVHRTEKPGGCQVQ